jgi:hypothetical protein
MTTGAAQRRKKKLAFFARSLTISRAARALSRPDLVDLAAGASLKTSARVASIARLAATRLGLLSTGSPRKTPRPRVGGRAARELGVGGHRWSRGAWRLRSASFAVALATVLILLRLSSSTMVLVRYDVASCLAKGPLAVSRLSVCHFASRPRRLGRGALLGDEHARGIYGASRYDLSLVARRVASAIG